MPFKSILSQEHSGNFVIDHSLTTPVLHDIQRLLGAGTIINTGTLYKPTGHYGLAHPDGHIRAERTLPGRETHVAVDNAATNPMQAARWAALQMYARSGGLLWLGPFATQPGPRVPPGRVLDVRSERLHDPELGMYPTQILGSKDGEAYLRVVAGSLRVALATVAVNFSKVFPRWHPGVGWRAQTGEAFAAHIVGAADYWQADKVLERAAAEPSRLTAARIALTGLTGLAAQPTLQ